MPLLPLFDRACREWFSLEWKRRYRPEHDVVMGSGWRHVDTALLRPSRRRAPKGAGMAYDAALHHVILSAVRITTEISTIPGNSFQHLLNPYTYSYSHADSKPHSYTYTNPHSISYSRPSVTPGLVPRHILADSMMICMPVLRLPRGVSTPNENDYPSDNRRESTTRSAGGQAQQIQK